MKGLWLTNDFPPLTGGEARLYAAICAGVPPGEVVVLAPKLPGDGAFDRLQPYRIERRRVPVAHHPIGRLAQMALFLLHGLVLTRRHAVQKVHVGHLYLGPVALALRGLSGVPYVLYLHGGEMAQYLRHRVIRGLVRHVVAGADLLVVNSSFTRQHFTELGMHHPRTVQLTLAVNAERFSAGDRITARARYGLDGRNVVLTVGRLVERKGHDTVIRAIGDIAAKTGPVEYIIVGEGPYEPSLRRLAQALGVEHMVRFLGRVADDDLASLYAACDLFVMPAREIPERDGVEGFGIAFLEAAAAGKAAVGSRSGGIQDAVDHDSTGLLIAPDDVAECAAAVVRLLNEPQLAETLGRQGRARAASLHGQWQTTLRAIWDGA